MAEDNNVIFYLEADASSALEAIASVTEALNSLKDALTTVGEAVSNLQGLDEALANVQTVGEEAATAAENVGTAVQTMGEEASSTADEMGVLAEQVDSAQAKFAALDEGLAAASEVTGTLAQEEEALASSMFTAVSASDAAAVAIDNLVNSGDSELLAMQEMIDFNLQFIDSSTAMGAAAIEAASGVTALNTELATGVEAATAAADAYMQVSNAMAGMGPAGGAAMAGMTAIDDGLALGMNNATAYANNMAAASVAEEEAGTAAESAGGFFTNLGGVLGGAVERMQGWLGAISQLAPHMSYMAFLVAAAGFQIVKMGTDAQTAMALLSGFAGVGPQMMAQLDPALQKLALDLGVTLTHAAQAAYFIVSAGFHDLPSIIALTTLSLKDAAASGANFETVARGLTALMIAYHVPLSGAAQINDEFIRTVVAGSQTMQQLSGVIGYFGATVRNDGVTALEALTTEATVTLLSGTHLKTGIQEVMHLFEQVGLQSDALAKRVQGLGISFDEASFKQLPMIDKLKWLAAAAAGDVVPATKAATEAISSQTIQTGIATSKFEAMINGTTSLKGAYLLLGDSGKHYADIMNQIQNGTSNLNSSFAGQQATMAAGWQHIAAGVSVFVYNLIKAASPILVPMMTSLGQAIGFVGMHMQQFLPIILSVGAALVGALGASVLGMIAGLLAGLLTPAGAIMLAFMGIGIVVANFGRIASTVGGFVHQFAGALLAIAGAASFVGLVLFNDLIMKVIFFAVTAMPQAIMTAIRFVPTLLSMVPALIMNTLNFMSLALSEIAAMLPLLPWIITIGLLVAGFMVLYNRTTIIQQVFAGLGKFFQQFGAALMADLKPAFDSVKQAFNEVMQALQPLIAAFNQARPAFIAIGAIAAGALAIAFGIILGLIRGLVGALGALVGGIAHILAGIITAFIGFATFIVNIVVFVQEALQGHWGAAFSHLGSAFQGLLTVARGVWEAISNVIMTPLRMIAAFIGGFVHGIVQFFTWLWHTLVGGSIVPDMINGIIHWFQMIIRVVSIIASFVSAIISAFLHLIGAIIGAIAGFIANVIGAWVRMVTAIVSAVMSFVNGLINLFHSLHGNVFQIIGQLVTGVITLFAQLVGRVEAAVGGFIISVISYFVRMGVQIVSAIASFVSQIIGHFTGMAGQVIGVLAGLAGQMFTWGAHLIQNLIGGITSMVGNLFSAIGGIAHNIANFLHFSKPDEGPLADIDTWMPHMGDLLSQGLQAQTGKIRQAALTVAGSIALATPAPASYLPGRPVGTSGGVSGSPDVVTALHSILNELQQHHRPQQASIGYAPLSNVVGTINTNTGTTGGGANVLAGLYQQLNVLAGRANENAKRGAGAGLGI